MQARGAGQREGRVGARGALTRGVCDVVLAAAVGAQAQQLRRPPSKSKAAGRGRCIAQTAEEVESRKAGV